MSPLPLIRFRPNNSSMQRSRLTPSSVAGASAAACGRRDLPPQSERASHYFQARLPDQFDEYIWFDTTGPVQPFATHELDGMPDTYPFGL